MANKTTAAVAYIRVSTDKQAEGGFSLEAQRAKIDAYAALYDLELVDVVVDAGVSAATLERPGLARALDMLKKKKAAALLVVKLDRLTRSVADLGELVETYFGEKGAALLSVSEQIDTRTAGGRLVLNVLASVSQWEREKIGERTSEVMRFKQSRGEYIGGRVPYGFDLVDGVQVRNEAEQAVIAVARELRAAGLSLRAVGAELARRGWYTRKCSAWDVSQIKNMVAA